MAPLQVVEYYLVANRQERLIRTLAAAHARFVANARYPLVPTGRCVARASCPAVRPEQGEDIVSAAEQRAKQGNLLRSTYRDRDSGMLRLEQRVPTRGVERLELRLEAPQLALSKLSQPFKFANFIFLAGDRIE